MSVDLRRRVALLTGTCSDILRNVFSSEPVGLFEVTDPPSTNMNFMFDAHGPETFLLSDFFRTKIAHFYIAHLSPKDILRKCYY